MKIFNFFSNKETRSLKFYSSFPKKNESILEGKFNYNEAFLSFTKATQQKQETALIVGAFSKKIQEIQCLIDHNTPFKVIDLGCADSSACRRYLKNINSSSGFDYTGFDTNQKFLEKSRKLLSVEPMIKKHTLINDNALSGKLHHRIDMKNQFFDFIFASHVAYYVKGIKEGHHFIQDILNLLSKTQGIAIFLHEDSTHYFRSTYNGQYNKISLPTSITQYTKHLLKTPQQFNSLKFDSKLHFSYLREELWEAAKNPQFYKKFAHEVEFVETLHKLAFIVQCDLLTLAKEGSLASYIHDIREKLEAHDHCFTLTTNMQTLVTPDCIFAHKIANISHEVEKEASLIFDHIKSYQLSSPAYAKLC